MQPVIGIACDMDDEVFRLRRNYVSAITDAGGIPLVIPPSAKDCNITRIADIISGLLLPGGGDLPPEYYGEELSVPRECLISVRKERIEWELALLKEAMKRELPVLGICLGMQLINVALGGDLYQDINLQVPGAGDHKKGAHAIKVSRAFLSTFSLQPSAFAVNSYHHQAVKTLAGGLEADAVSEDGITEGFIKRDYPFLAGVQWHPERPLCKQTSPGAQEEASRLLLNSRSCDKLSVKIFATFIEKARIGRNSKS